MIIADDRIMTMAIYNMTKPQNGETNATPSGLVNHSFTYCYNHNTPSGLFNCGYSAIYKPYTLRGADGKPISAEEFLITCLVNYPNFSKDEEELRKLWSSPITRRILLDNLDAAGFPKDDLLTLQKLVDMEKSDLYDVSDKIPFDTT